MLEGSSNRTLQLVNSCQPRTVQQSYIHSPSIKWRSLPRHQREILQVEKSLDKIKNILFLQWLRFQQWLKDFRLPIRKQTTEKNNREGPKTCLPLQYRKSICFSSTPHYLRVTLIWVVYYCLWDPSEVFVYGYILNFIENFMLTYVISQSYSLGSELNKTFFKKKITAGNKAPIYFVLEMAERLTIEVTLWTVCTPLLGGN